MPEQRRLGDESAERGRGRHSIQKEGLRPGDALLIESDMRVSVEVGRSSLYEALRILEQQGAIAIRPGRGGGLTVGLPDSRQLAANRRTVLRRRLRTPGVRSSFR
nr:GntR family transcriptional regulator [Rhodococcus wratislaviensis]